MSEPTVITLPPHPVARPKLSDEVFLPHVEARLAPHHIRCYTPRGMRFFRIISIFVGVSVVLTSAYGLYALVVCENHSLSHSFLGAACPKTDFLRYMTEWRQLFVGFTEEILIFSLLFLAIALLGIGRAPVVERGLMRFHFSEKQFLGIKPALSFLRFIFRGSLKPEIYGRA